MKRLLTTLVFAAGLLGAPLAQAGPVTFFAVMDGPSEAPVPNASPGTGSATVIFDTVAHTMRVMVNFSGLIGTVTVAHIHSRTAVPNTGTAGVATTLPTFPGFPSGVTSGTYDNTFDMTLSSSYNPSFVTGNGGTTASAEMALFAGLLAERAYLNIHTTAFGGGEIRGFLHEVPEPGSLALLGLALAGAAATRKRRAA